MRHNPVEQVLKLSVRYRNNSLFYKTLHGAYVGDVLASLIETCRLNGVNPIDYLSALLHNRSAVFADTATRTGRLGAGMGIDRPWCFRHDNKS
jgi:hypothetical protein